MAALSRGKRMLLRSIKDQSESKVQKTETPLEIAKSWIAAGLDPDNFNLQFISDYVGYGVFSKKKFQKGDFLLEYHGNLLQGSDINEMKAKHIKHNEGCYMFYFHYKGKRYCKDATEYFEYLGRMINDAHGKEENCFLKVVPVNGKPYLCLFAKGSIEKGHQLCYNYGDSTVHWRKKKPNKETVLSPSSSDIDDLFDPPYSPSNCETSDESEVDGELIHRNTELSIGDGELDTGDRELSIGARELLSIGDDANQLNQQLQCNIPSCSLDMVPDSCPETDNNLQPINLKMVSSPQELLTELQHEAPTAVYSEESSKHAGKVPVRRENGENQLFKGKSFTIVGFNVEQTRYLHNLITSCAGDVATQNTKRIPDYAIVPIIGNSIDRTVHEVVTDAWLKISVEQGKLQPVDGNEIFTPLNPKYELNLPLERTVISIRGYKSTERDVITHIAQILGAVCQDTLVSEAQPQSNLLASTHLVVNSAEEFTYQTALKLNIPAIDKSWLIRCAKESKKLPEGDFLVGKEKDKLSSNTGLKCLVCDKLFKTKGGLTVHLKTHTIANDTKYTKPSRLCPFCEVPQSQFARHIFSKHKDKEEVASASLLPQKSIERKRAIEKFRKLGILYENRKEILKEHPKYKAERCGDKELVCCSKCQGFYSKHIFHRHKERCIQDEVSPPTSMQLSLLNVDVSDNFTKDILLHFNNDSIGHMCRTNETLILIGRQLFTKNVKKVEKLMETRKSVMSDMRLLAKLFEAFQERAQKIVSVEDMFKRQFFSSLEQAIIDITTENGKLKYGLKYALSYLIKNASDILMCHKYANLQDEAASEFKKFKKMLALSENKIFGDATYHINKSRQEKLRMPEMRADEVEIDKLRLHTSTTIKKYASHFDMVTTSDFVTLRDAVCCRVTLFNARRGGEPCRLKIGHWRDACSSRWIDNEQFEKLPEVEKRLFNQMKIVYQTGKGNHLVPVLIPHDCFKAIELLTDSQVREEAGVLQTNNFIFANTQSSVFHVSGWDTIRAMCELAKIAKPELITASKQRHRISTLYAALDLPEGDRDVFYRHMGHSKGVNEGTYQYPLPILEMTKVGKQLLKIDQKTTNEEPNIDVPSERPGTSANNNDNEDVEGQENEKMPSINSKHSKVSRYRWSGEETKLVQKEFEKWISLAKGNCLPGRKLLQLFVTKSTLQCSWKQLHTKIMNEQNKHQRKVSKRWQQMSAE